MKQFRDTAYYVTENGDVFRKWGETFKKLKPQIRDKYFSVRLSINGIARHFRVNRLVAECYISNPENKPLVDHLDCN